LFIIGDRCEEAVKFAIGKFEEICVAILHGSDPGQRHQTTPTHIRGPGLFIALLSIVLKWHF